MLIHHLMDATLIDNITERLYSNSKHNAFQQSANLGEPSKRAMRNQEVQQIHAHILSLSQTLLVY